MISVIMIQYNNAALTNQAIVSFQRHVGCEYEFIVVDNASTDPGAREALSEQKGIRVIFAEENLGFSKANNLAARQARGELLLFLNNDTVTGSDFVTSLAEEFRKDSRLGIAGPRLLNADGSFQLSAGDVPTLAVEARDKVMAQLARWRWDPVLKLTERRSLARTDVEWVTGAALMVRRNLFEELGGFDEEFFMFFEDKDLCLRASQRGFTIRYVPGVTVMHLLGGSSKAVPQRIRRIYRESQRHYYRKHRNRLEQVLVGMYAKLADQGEK